MFSDLFKICTDENIFSDQNLLILCPQNDKDRLVHVLSHKELYYVFKNPVLGPWKKNNLHSFFGFFHMQCSIYVTLCPNNGCLRLMQVWNFNITYYVVFLFGNEKRICLKTMSFFIIFQMMELDVSLHVSFLLPFNFFRFLKLERFLHTTKLNDIGMVNSLDSRQTLYKLIQCLCKYLYIDE